MFEEIEIEPERHMPYDVNDYETAQDSVFELDGFTFWTEPAPEEDPDDGPR